MEILVQIANLSNIFFDNLTPKNKFYFSGLFFFSVGVMSLSSDKYLITSWFYEYCL